MAGEDIKAGLGHGFDSAPCPPSVEVRGEPIVERPARPGTAKDCQNRHDTRTAAVGIYQNGEQATTRASNRQVGTGAAAEDRRWPQAARVVGQCPERARPASHGSSAGLFSPSDQGHGRKGVAGAGREEREAGASEERSFGKMTPWSLRL
ncbi:hypothetical protein CDD83_2957 [Cordyceps sp. RAO-2017]|nr:hypothetical protein CDD83_2957 [Cordyceps sp. RAO-2017]